MRYIKSKYYFAEKISQGTFLHFSSLSNEFLLLNERKHEIATLSDVSEIESRDTELYTEMIEKRYLIPENFDETAFITDHRYSFISDKDCYHVMINTTLDCNLDCWYCYESKVKGSKLTSDVIHDICQNISKQYELQKYKLLKISFFGGEPFMNWKGMQSIIDFVNKFCSINNLKLCFDITTNATLVSESMVKYLSPYNCFFQITLDGSEEKHNSIKKILNTNVNCYKRTLQTLRWISKYMNDYFLAIRINFDDRVLNEIDQLLKDIDFINRQKSYIIVKKVWQVSTTSVEKDKILTVLQKIFDHKFFPNYNYMPKNDVCFAERENEVLFNYDGKVFKCSTISSFDEANTLGKLDEQSGLVIWNDDVIEKWLDKSRPSYCLSCKWYGICHGPCTRQLLAHPGQRICGFENLMLDDKEYLMYLFKCRLIMDELHNAESTPHGTNTLQPSINETK